MFTNTNRFSGAMFFSDNKGLTLYYKTRHKKIVPSLACKQWVTSDICDSITIRQYTGLGSVVKSRTMFILPIYMYQCSNNNIVRLKMVSSFVFTKLK